MLYKISLVVLLVAVIVALGNGFYHLVHSKGSGHGLLKSLAWRIGLAFFLFIYILVGIQMGWITPQDPFEQNRKNTKIESTKKAN